ncbi:MAG: hypothetical protein QM486_10820 [Flavobacteriaceae bacterium]
MKIDKLITEIKNELSLKSKDVKQLGSEYIKLERQIVKLSKNALYGNIILKDKKYYVFVSKMVKGKRVRKQLGCDDKLKTEHEQRLGRGLELTIAKERLTCIEDELLSFYQRLINLPI